MRRVAVEYFGNLAEAFLRGVSAYLRQPLPGLCPSFARMALHVEVCGDKRSHQPGPDRALVIGAVAAPGIALVPAAIPRIAGGQAAQADRKSTRLNSSHLGISYAVFCLKKKRTTDYWFPVCADLQRLSRFYRHAGAL